MKECENCEIRKFIAKVFDLHWLDEYDCPYECDKVKEENNDHD